jgi:hypothetical protein
MARGQLSVEDRLRQTITRLKQGIKKRDARIVILETQVKELTQKLTDLGYQFEQMKMIVFGRKLRVKKLIDNDDNNDKETPATRSKDSYKRPIPNDQEITQTINYSLPIGVCKKTRTRIFYVEDIPLDLKKVVTKYSIEQGFNGNQWIGEISLPNTRVIIGENIRMLVTTLSIEQKISQNQIINLLKILFQTTISVGEIDTLLQKESVILETTHETILDQIRKAPYHHLDETSWKIKGESGYGWSITDDGGRSAYELGVSRGNGVAEKLRGDSESIIISDDYVAYRYLAHYHQLCWAHLIRHFRDLAQSD